MPDLVAVAVDLRHDVRPPLGRPARHEERGRDPIAVEKVQDERHTDFRAVGALRHDAEPVDVGGIARDPRGLRIEVEGQACRGAYAGRPGDRSSHRRSSDHQCMLSPEEDAAMDDHVPSYWAATVGPEPDGIRTLEGDRRADVAVIGGGYTGLAAAYRLAGTHGLDTIVLEANEIGWGASARNGGFALITLGKVGLEERIRHWGVEAARRPIAIGVEAIETVRELIAREHIACDPGPDGSLLVAHRPSEIGRAHV